MGVTDGYKPVSFRGFGGGLNLKAQPDVLREDQALDCMNVTLTVSGAVKQRDGFGKLTASALTNRPDSIGGYYRTDGTKHIVVGNGARLDALNTSGTSIANAATSAGPHFFARFGGPVNELLFCANGTDTVRQWNGTAFSTPAYTSTTPSGKFLGVTGWDNRLVSANHAGSTAAANPSSVIFSDPGDPLSFKAGAPDNNYEQLTPGDGEQIMGVCSWREYLFVFKESSFFVFYGTGTGTDGYPIFNYRQIRAGVGLASSRALAVGRDGVYFLDRKGVYRTDGREPVLLSEIVEPLFLGGPSDYYLGGTLNHSAISSAAMTWHDEKIYLSFPTATTNDRMLVLDPRQSWWTLWDIPASCLASFRVSNQAELIFGYATGTNDLGRHALAYNNDDGVAISSRWRSGWFDYGDPSVKTIRESKVWGAGTFQYGISKDFSEVVPTPVSIDLVGTPDTWGDGTNPSDLWGDGTNPSDVWGAPQTAVIPRLVRLRAIRGTVFSVRFSNSVLNRSWQIRRFANHLRESRPPTIVRTET